MQLAVVVVVAVAKNLKCKPRSMSSGYLVGISLHATATASATGFATEACSIFCFVNDEQSLLLFGPLSTVSSLSWRLPPFAVSKFFGATSFCVGSENSWTFEL